MDKLASGLNDFTAGYQENRNTPFQPENLQQNNINYTTQGGNEINQNKNIMNRLGEGAGSIARVANNPNLQGLLAGGLVGLLTGNPIAGLGVGYGIANKNDTSRLLQKVLADKGVDFTPSYGLGVSNKTFNDVVNTKLADDKLEQLTKYQMELIKAKLQDLAIKQQNADTNKYKAINGTKVTHMGGGKGVNSGDKSTNKPTFGENEYVEMEAPNGKIYKVPANQIDKYKKAGGKLIG